MENVTPNLPDVQAFDDSIANSFVSNESVFVSLLFPIQQNPHSPSSVVIPFKAKELLFLNAFNHNTPLDKAAEQAGMSIDQAKRFLDRKDTRAFMWDCLQRSNTARYWMEPANCIAEGAKVWSGEVTKTKSQMKVWDAFIDRALPKKIMGNVDTGTKIQINIDPEAVREAFRRDDAIEAEISRETL